MPYVVMEQVEDPSSSTPRAVRATQEHAEAAMLELQQATAAQWNAARQARFDEGHSCRERATANYFNNRFHITETV